MVRNYVVGKKLVGKKTGGKKTHKMEIVGKKTGSKLRKVVWWPTHPGISLVDEEIHQKQQRENNKYDRATWSNLLPIVFDKFLNTELFPSQWVEVLSRSTNLQS